MSQNDHDSSRREKPEAESLPLWAWLGRPRAWSAGQGAAVAMLASLAMCVLAVLSSPAATILLLAKGLAVMAYLLLAFALGREIVRSFRCE